jgi:hypothetical protein
MSLPNYRGRRVIEGSTNPEVDVEQNAEIDDLFYDHLTPDSASAGPPTSGTFTLNAWWRDTNGIRWQCTVAGTPGTWVPIGPRDNRNIEMRGILADNQLWALHQRPYFRLISAVEICIDGNAPSGGSFVVQLLVGGSLKSQQYTVTSGNTHNYVAVTGDGNGGSGSGLAVAANATLQAKVISANGTSDATVTPISNTP